MYNASKSCYKAFVCCEACVTRFVHFECCSLSHCLIASFSPIMSLSHSSLLLSLVISLSLKSYTWPLSLTPRSLTLVVLSLSLSLPLSLSLLVMRCVAFSFRGMALLPPRAQVMLGDEYDLRCDVFSFALTCWEMVACDVPFANYSSRQAAHLISQGLRPTVPPHCPEWLAMLMVACNAHVPVARPTFATVSALFQSATIDSDGLTEGIDKCDAPRSVPHLASLPRTPSPRSVCHRPLRSHQSLVVAACLA